MDSYSILIGKTWNNNKTNTKEIIVIHKWLRHRIPNSTLKFEINTSWIDFNFTCTRCTQSAITYIHGFYLHCISVTFNFIILFTKNDLADFCCRTSFVLLIRNIRKNVYPEVKIWLFSFSYFLFLNPKYHQECHLCSVLLHQLLWTYFVF